MNGAMLYWPIENVFYVEGWALDQFAANKLQLVRRNNCGNKIGVILDAGMEEELIARHVQVVDAARATLGLNVIECAVTSSTVGVRVALSESGASYGDIENSDTLIQAASYLIGRGCDAIAVVVRFPEDENEEQFELFRRYQQGQGVDYIAGAEALISHLITKQFLVPCAHSPAFAPTEIDVGVYPPAPNPILLVSLCINYRRSGDHLSLLLIHLFKGSLSLARFPYLSFITQGQWLSRPLLLLHDSPLRNYIERDSKLQKWLLLLVLRLKKYTLFFLLCYVS